MRLHEAFDSGRNFYIDGKRGRFNAGPQGAWCMTAMSLNVEEIASDRWELVFDPCKDAFDGLGIAQYSGEECFKLGWDAGRKHGMEKI